MCGIAGIAYASERTAEPNVLRAMCDAMRHRGPDDEGIYLGPGIGLGMRRLSIIDVAGGHQPIASSDGLIQVILNGEIYNFRAVRDFLEARGHHFKTNTDTEAILHSYEEYGVDFLEHIEGMFALAVWDGRVGRLILARDRLGEKPLYYSERSGCLVFGSEVKCLLQCPEISAEVDPESFASYLAFRFVPAPATMLRSVCQLLPGERAVYERGHLRLDRYWRLTFRPGTLPGTSTERDAVFLGQLRAAVRSRLMSDVPIGAFLSGGLDSATVVALMAEASSTPVKTFSIGFEHAEFDERPYARLVAQHCGTQHEEFVTEPAHAEDVLPSLAWHLDNPLGDSSALPTYFLAQMTRKSVTVALTGDGGDELLAGYTRYAGERFSQLYRQLTGPFAGPASEGLSRVSSLGPSAVQARVRRLAKLTREAAQDRLERYVSKLTYLEPDTWSRLVRSGERDQLSAVVRRYVGNHALDQLDPVTYISALDTFFYLPNDMLPKVDRMTMASSLEARAPFLTQHLVELAARLPVEDKLSGLTTKAILRRVMRPYLPKTILSRSKQGFSVPLKHWFRTGFDDFARDLLLSDRSDIRTFVHQKVLEDLFSQHLSGEADHSEQLWILMIFEVWHRLFVSRRLSWSGQAAGSISATMPA